MQGEIKWQRVEHFVSTPVGDGIVILNLDKGRFYSLSETGAAIWNSLEQPKSAEDIANVLVMEFEVTAEDSASAVEAFLARLREKELICLVT